MVLCSCGLHFGIDCCLRLVAVQQNLTKSIRKKQIHKYLPLRKCISSNDNELIIYGIDNFSQFPRRNASVSSKCDRELSVACRDDLVVLRGELDIEYHNCLHSHDIAPQSWIAFCDRIEQTVRWGMGQYAESESLIKRKAYRVPRSPDSFRYP